MRDPIWRHLGLLVLAAVLLTLVQYAALAHGRAPAAGWPAALSIGLLDVPIYVYWLLPVAAGVAAGTSAGGRRGARPVLAAMLVVLAAMIVLDLWLGPAAAAAARLRAGEPGLSAAPGRASEGGPALAVMARLLTGRLPGAGEWARGGYASVSARPAAVGAVVRSMWLLTPFILIGLAGGLGQWLERRVVFRYPHDALTVRWIAAWVVVPAASALLLTWSGRSTFAMLFRGAPLWSPVVPYVPLAILAAVGWWALAASPAGVGPPADPAGRSGAVVGQRAGPERPQGQEES